MITIDLTAPRFTSTHTAFESVTAHRVTGPRTHNPEFGHQAVVSHDGTAYLAARATIISTHPDSRSQAGDALTIGDTVTLRFPDGTLSAPLVVTSRPLADPALIPAG